MTTESKAKSRLDEIMKELLNHEGNLQYLSDNAKASLNVLIKEACNPMIDLYELSSALYAVQEQIVLTLNKINKVPESDDE
jgi:hypothetical protein